MKRHPMTGSWISAANPRKWLAEFRSDFGSIIRALDDWKAAACSITYGANDCNFSPRTKLDIPSWFNTLTQIIALWCDVELHIDPSPLCEFRRRMHDFKGHHGMLPDGRTGLIRKPMTDREIDDCIWIALDTYDRVLHATLAMASEEQVEALTANNDRDKWLYEQCCKLVTYSTIRNRLEKKSGGKTKWEPIDSDQGVRQAANRYAKSNHLPPIPSRQPGRKPAK